MEDKIPFRSRSNRSEKIKFGISACLLGSKCNFNGNDLLSLFIKDLESRNQIQFVSFCPEDAVLMDGSPSCGSNVLLQEESCPAGGFKRGVGVAAALLRRNNITVFSSFDELLVSHFLESAIQGFKRKKGL